MKTIDFNNLPEAVGLLIEKIDRLERILKEQKLQNYTATSDEPLTIEKAAEFLNLAIPTVYSMVSKMELPHYKRSKRLYFLREDLLAYIRAGRQQTNAEIMEDVTHCLNKTRRA